MNNISWKMMLPEDNHSKERAFFKAIRDELATCFD